MCRGSEGLSKAEELNREGAKVQRSQKNILLSTISFVLSGCPWADSRLCNDFLFCKVAAWSLTNDTEYATF